MLRQRSKYSRRTRDYAYMAWVKTLDCCVARELNTYSFCRWPIEADHAWNDGMGRKCQDRFTVPLCREHHRQKHDHSGYFASLDKMATRRLFERWVAETMSRYSELPPWL
jgi:hypothetical protein